MSEQLDLNILRNEILLLQVLDLLIRVRADGDDDFWIEYCNAFCQVFETNFS
jgi:hypothetical protein